MPCWPGAPEALYFLCNLAITNSANGILRRWPQYEDGEFDAGT